MILSPALYAGDFSIGVALEYRDSNTTTQPSTFISSFGYDDTFWTFQFQEDEYSASFIYQPRIGKTVSFKVITHSLYVPHEGGFSDFSLVFNQNFRWKYFGIRYSLGSQVGIAYSEYASFLSFSVSPIVGIGLDLVFHPVKLSLDYGLNDDIERSWKAIPIARASLSFDIKENHQLALSGFLREAEYGMDPWHMITAWGLSFCYTYRGSL